MRRAGTRRDLRLSEEMRRELARMLTNESADPRLAGVVVTGLRLNPDATVAEVLYSLGRAADPDQTLAALNKAAGFLRSGLVQRMRLKQAPELRFVHDDFLEDLVYV